jgi:acyl dehydratase/CBS domain-containing protein
MLVPIAVRDVSQAPVETVSPTASARTVARRLRADDGGSLVVCEDGEAVGIVTDRDVTDLVADGNDPGATTVREFMASPVVTTAPEASIESAAERMREHEVTRLPVVEDGDVVGIVTTTDLSNFLPHLVRMGREQAPDESRERTSVRVDTAYAREEWDFEYLGDESAIDVGDTVRFSKPLTDDDVAAFAEASGDTNRLHLEADYAAGTRFGRRIVHGTLVAGVISAALARLPGLIVYLSQDVSYLGPVDVGDRVTAEAEVVEDIGNSRFRLTTTVSTEAEGRVVDGEAVVISDPLPDGA